MSAVAIVAARRDAEFAEQVRAGLKAAGREAFLQEQLPTDSSAQVVLIWSAGLESGHAIDAQALIGLWSENRLVVARRDASPLPLGLRDLPSLDASKTPTDVVAALRAAESAELGMIGRPALARADSAPTIAEAPRKRTAPAWIAGIAIAVFAAGLGWYYVTAEQRAREAALSSALESAAKASEELKAAQAMQLAALKSLERAREAEAKARASGDVAALKSAQAAAQRAEEEAQQQLNLVKAQEEKAGKAREAVKSAGDAAKLAKAEPAKPEMVAAAPKAEVPAPVAEVPKAEAPKAAAKASPATKAMSRSERERLLDEEAARKALETARRAPVKQETQVAAAAPTAVAPAESGPANSNAESESLYQQALAMEEGGDAKGAIRIYRRAARAGSGKAAKRLGEIFDRGVGGVPRDYAESLQWYETARQLGENVETAGRREGRSASEILAEERARAPIPAPVPETKASTPEPMAAPVSKPAPAVAPEQKAAPVAKPAPVVAPEPAKAAEPAPASAVAAPEPAPERHRSGSWRYLLVAAFVLAIIYWRRSRRRRARAAAAPVPAQAPAVSAPVAAAPTSVGEAMLFVSYSHKDRGRVEPIVSAIEQMGRRVWMDRSDITGQTGWAGQIVRAIRECRAVVLMASPNSYSSDQVVRELYLAMNHKKAIVPIEIEPAEMPDELQYILAPFQHHRLSGGETRAVLGRALAAI